MKLEYNIVWFENENSFFSSGITLLDELNDFFNDKGFNLHITIFHNEIFQPIHKSFISPKEYITLQKVDNYLPATLASKNTIIQNSDLILVDYNLGGSHQDGDNIIKHIRDTLNGIYTEVLFYSTSFEEEQLREKIQRDGLFYSKRENLLKDKKKLEKIASVTIKKTQDLNNLRGLVMAETSEIDTILKNMLLTLKSQYNLNCVVLNRCNKGPCGACSDCKKENRQFSSSSGDIIFTIKRKRPLNSDKNIETALSVELFEGVKSFINSPLNTTGYTEDDILGYRDEIKRNILAHYPEDTSTKDKMYITDDNGTTHEFTDTDFENIRKSIKKYKSIFEDIRNKL